MSDLLMPGATNLARRSNRAMLGGPSRATHHITWDRLKADGTRAATLDGVSRYLLDVGYEPHVVIDPFTGQVRQLLDALASGFALQNQGVQTNRRGRVNLQVEWFFTPGTVYEGVRYATLTDTPMKGLVPFLAWCDSWGIPRRVPMAPKVRTTAIWLAEAGHYGHYNAPFNSHSDPVVSIDSILAKAVVVVPPRPPAPPTVPPFEGGPYRRGHAGIGVRVVQSRLNVHGFALVLDGDFGPATHRAVVTFQTRSGLVADGVVGIATWKAMWS